MGDEKKLILVTDRNLEIAIEALESHDDFSCERAAEILRGIRANPDLEYKPPPEPKEDAPKLKKVSKMK